MLSFYLSMLETEQEKKRIADIYEAYQLTFLYIAKSILQDDLLAEDAVHNAFLDLIRKKELLELPTEELKALLIVIVKRRSIDIMRQMTRNTTENIDDIESIPSPEDPVEIQISTSEDYRRLTDLIRCLNESHRSILQLKYFAELSNTEIGEYLGITNRQVETQLYKAKQRLREAFLDR